MHLKISKAPKLWPIPRKGRKFVVVPMHNKNQGIPLLLVLRELLKVVHTRREAKLILREGKVQVNNNLVRNEKLPVKLFDIISFNDKQYRVVFGEHGKFSLDSGSERVAKIIGKTLLSQGRVQIHLNTGDNYIVHEQYQVGDSVLLGKKGIEKIIPLKKGTNALVVSGKLVGLQGEISEIKKGFATLTTQNEKHIITLKNIMALP